MDLEEEAAQNVKKTINQTLKGALGSFVADAVFSTNTDLPIPGLAVPAA